MTTEADVAVSELVANALQHGSPPIRLFAIRVAGVVHVEVHDERRDFGSAQEHSFGLRLVDTFASEWGVTPLRDDGKVVWADLRA
jgi:anti-sigma regulatory factor (Ser/Thr protein kinase)